MRFIALILTFTFCVSGTAQVIYVDVDATGANNGTSWSNAYTDLQDALAEATAGDEIWVAEGVYKPTTTTDRTVSFVLIDGVALYGGFGGSESTRDERDWTLHESILSGDIGKPNDEDDNSYHVVVGSGVDMSAILDGFTVERGKASSSTAPNDRGGGILVLSGNPTVRNSTLRDNLAVGGGVQRGGGGYLENSSIVIEDCVFETNGAFGGALYIDGGAPLIRGSQFLNNVTGAIVFVNGSTATLEDTVFGSNIGSGVFLESSSPTFRRVTFRDNVSCAGCDGGAMRIEGSAEPYFEDSLFENNSSGSSSGGGAVYIDDTARPVFVRTTFRANTSGSAGGAISSRQLNGFTLIIDCVFERNTALSAGAVLLSGAHGGVVNSVFVGNKTTFEDRGGALLITNPSASGDGILVANSIFVGNRGDKGGGLRLTSIGDSDVHIINTTIAFNEALIEGGGVYSRDFGAPFTEARFENVIIYGNTAPEGANIYWEDFDSGPPEVTRSIVGGGYEWGTDILDVDPLFVRNPDPGPDMTWGTDDDDYGDLRLRMGSPGIDYGLEAFLPADIWDLDGDGNTTEPLPVDLNGDPRVLKTEVDLGPYEGAVFVSNEQEVPEAGFALSVFPNPSREAADLRFRPARPSHINIAVFDLLGRQVAVLADERFNAGSYQRVFDGRELPSGTYVIRAHVVPQDGSAPQTHTQRLTLLK